ncbi:L-seryl-tRNA(Sec) selenium transferase [Bacillus sp. S/N-304-OC-R1]|uniref:L-seryl-tRNA(Sec) selenium transferase n=1 Tax=Bacillus sp. S/N-304-OC-R1 TaxID=2758034 RepID=UPI001C8D7CA4|nr:L-seryl-tRNA(Sec) selenium transferase [Bacillus sp. S/N-304-OC-R1]MBY0120530.1 L-seryl-tRNA(Sec) selenium transferase [Bacillus sp. S/N-304-OC-R1]
MNHLLRNIPPVHEFQKDARFILLEKENGINSIHITNELKNILSQVREELLQNIWNGPEPGTIAFIEEVFNRLKAGIKKNYSYTLKRVINATGTILHTNLGRSRLSENAIQHMLDIAHHYSNLEYKIEEGERGARHSHAELLIKELTGAEAAMVVNNNAAAVYLILKAFADKKDVIVSRGQLVEIGGSFRISSIMEESGANLVEVGTTNKTHLSDYEKAISEHTAMVLKVHTSNFKVIGFTQSVETEELAKLAKKSGIIFYEDLGSGALYDFRQNGIGEEPVVKKVLKEGAHLVSFSGDKLLGGPQAGVIAGKKEYISVLKSHQLARVLRVDKLTLSALEGTLLEYIKGNEKSIPVIREITMTQLELKVRTEAFVGRLQKMTEQYQISIRNSMGQIGGGTMPEVELPSIVAVLNHKSLTAEQLAKKLRTNHHTPIVVRIQKDEVFLDLRSVTDEEELTILEVLQKL